MGPIVCRETSLTTSLRCVAFHKSASLKSRKVHTTLERRLWLWQSHGMFRGLYQTDDAAVRLTS